MVNEQYGKGEARKCKPGDFSLKTDLVKPFNSLVSKGLHKNTFSDFKQIFK